MRRHHPSDRTTCDSNRDGITAGCWLDRCACFSSGFTDLDKQKPGLPPDSPTGCWSSTAVWSEWVETSCSLLFSFRFRTWGVFAECCSLSVKCRFAFLDFGCAAANPSGQIYWLKTHWRIWENNLLWAVYPPFAMCPIAIFTLWREIWSFFVFFFFITDHLLHPIYVTSATPVKLSNSTRYVVDNSRGGFIAQNPQWLSNKWFLISSSQR